MSLKGVDRLLLLRTAFAPFTPSATVTNLATYYVRGHVLEAGGTAVSKTNTLFKSPESRPPTCVVRDAGAQGMDRLSLAGEGRRRSGDASIMETGFPGRVVARTSSVPHHLRYLFGFTTTPSLVTSVDGMVSSQNSYVEPQTPVRPHLEMVCRR